MTKHIARFSALILFIFTSAIYAEGSSQELTVRAEVKAPESRAQLCELLLSRLADAPLGDDSHPLKKFFSMIGLMLHNSSGMSDLDGYQGLRSVDRARELVGILKGKDSAQRRGQIHEIYQLFGRASATGDDFNLAVLLHAMDQLTRIIDRELFFAGFGFRDDRTSTENFSARFMSKDSFDDPDKELSAIADAWARLAPHHRAGFAEWLGRSFSEGAKSYTTTTIKFTDNKPTSVTTCQMLPDLRTTLEDYLGEHPGDKRELTRQYYRHMASKLLFIYGINYSETEGTSATPTLAAPQAGSALQRIKVLLLGCR